MFEKFKEWVQDLNVFFNDDAGFDFHPRQLRLSGSDYRVSRADRSAAAQMVKVEEAIYRARPWPKEAFEIEMDQRNRLYLQVVDEKKGELVAFAGLSINFYREDGHITNIGVHPAYQGQGIGRSLLRILMQVSCRLGMKTMSLEVKRANLRAQNLYTDLGFKTVRMRPHYYQDDGDDAYEMTLSLTTMKGIEHE